MAALFTYVFLKIQWHDSLIDQSVSMEDTVRIEILSHWNKFPLKFKLADTDTVKTIATFEQAQHLNISPGFFTYFNYADTFWLSLGFLAFLSVLGFSAFRWHWLVNAQQLSLSLSQAIRLTLIGIFFNNFVPGQTGGDLIKAYYIAKKSPTKKMTAILTVITDRLIGLSALVVVSLVTVSVFYQRFSQLAIFLWGAIIVSLLAISILLSRRFRRKLGLSSLVKKLPEKVSAIIYQLDNCVQSYRHHKLGIFVWWLLSIGNHLINVIGIYFLAKAIDMGVPAIEFFALVPIIFIVSSLPLAPGGWGIGEALFGKLFSEYGSIYLVDTVNAQQIMHTRGVALSILFRIINTLISLIGGLVILISHEKIPKHPTNFITQSNHENRHSERN